MDEELAAVWRRWWLPTYAYGSAVPPEHADEEFKSLVAHLAEHGFAIVRRMDSDLSG